MTLAHSKMQLIEYTIVNLQSLEPLARFFLDQNITHYRHPIGEHIRHIIEHYEALILSESSSINYDARARDEFLEKSPAEAIQRIGRLCKQLQKWTVLELEQIVEISSTAGVLGETAFINASSRGRELCVLNSHAIHHLAIIKPVCLQLAIPLDEYFGFAPSTIAYLESQKLEAL